MKTNRIVTIQISEFLSRELAAKIAASQWHKPEWADNVISLLYDGKTTTDCFNVIAQTDCGDVVGRLFCMKNDTDCTLWYYGDLFVIPEYQRMHIADNMLKTAENHLISKCCRTLCTYVEEDNIPSLALQKKNGFLPKPYRTFNALSCTPKNPSRNSIENSVNVI